MSDLLRRLRKTHCGSPLEVASRLSDLCDEAANEFERLLALLYQCTGVMDPDHPDPHHRHALAGALAALRGEVSDAPPDEPAEDRG